MDDERVIRVLVMVFMGVTWGAMALVRERQERQRFHALLSELTTLRFALQSEGDRMRAFLELQEGQRLRSRGREAQIRLDAQDEADAQARIAVSRLLDVQHLGYDVVTDAQIRADIAAMTSPGKQPKV